MADAAGGEAGSKRSKRKDPEKDTSPPFKVMVAPWTPEMARHFRDRLDAEERIAKDPSKAAEIRACVDWIVEHEGSLELTECERALLDEYKDYWHPDRVDPDTIKRYVVIAIASSEAMDSPLRVVATVFIFVPTVGVVLPSTDDQPETIARFCYMGGVRKWAAHLYKDRCEEGVKGLGAALACNGRAFAKQQGIDLVIVSQPTLPMQHVLETKLAAIRVNSEADIKWLRALGRPFWERWSDYSNAITFIYDPEEYATMLIPLNADVFDRLVQARPTELVAMPEDPSNSP